MIRRRPAARRVAADTPIGELNITPLIDVMLVLLVMFIIAVPAMTHKVPIDLPTSGGEPATPPTIHRLTIAADGAVALDGTAVASGALAGRLAPIAADTSASLILDPDAGARYEVFDRTLADVRRAGIDRLGFANNARFADF